jgi:hypothetical protein
MLASDGLSKASGMLIVIARKSVKTRDRVLI